MLFFLLTFSSIFALNYRVGETFGYSYNTVTKTLAVQSANEEESTQMSLSCDVKFKVLKVDSQGAYMEMTVSNVRGSTGNSVDSGAMLSDPDVQEDFSDPLYFTHRPDGTITGVIVSEDDEPDQVELKVGIAYALQTNTQTKSNSDYEAVSVISPQGMHLQYSSVEVEDDYVEINTHYTEEDFIEFLDSKLSVKDIALDASSNVRILNGKVATSTSQTSVNLNKQYYGSNDEAAVIYGEGTANLFNLRMGNSEEVDFNYESPEAFLQANTNYKYVEYLTPSFYEDREHPEEEEDLEDDDITDGKMACPSQTDVCKGFDKSFTLGNKNLGLRMSASAVAAISKGCKPELRNYIAGSYANIDVLVLGKTYSAASAYAEYGQIGGSPTRNGVELKLFGLPIYSKSFPWLDCVDRTINLASKSKDISFSYFIMVYIVKITFSVGLTFQLSADLHYSLCAQQLTASVQLIPRGAATVHGGASASVVLAKAGIELSGTVAEHFDPTAYIDGNQCRVGFYMYANHEPYDARFIGYWQLRTKLKVKIKWRGFKTKVKITWGWGSKHSTTFWHHSGGGSRSKLVDVYYQGK
ncbi:putative lipid transport family protein [Monocercomonoides exilis]|uniref:putative lipid transport family protein n=1 Tax=Monocercomonoides exilis TaxID=2049356 RepID=UPI003559DEBB|nr:putative lipid transport family protein [Monocercomonoides exilis]|eukprot:MONOS_11173.1-p1 / transcript=MONOS_11173.1 / gene=MONOS_11173 / organism=Monocercomonoides_exilis_PA203 / gene_product=lipid transport family protein / transcript_product=lipid transport family protein / location=Mono_scaffold00546:19852-21657(-) / protein_length=581 / sequence_SO=supercontig / SO=protein_coding / is_pseudo=false